MQFNNPWRLTGFVRKSSAPSSIRMRDGTKSDLPDINTNCLDHSSGSRLISRRRIEPPPPGISMSLRIRSGRCFRANSRPATPESASMTSYPPLRRIKPNSARSGWSSSTSKIVFIRIGLPCEGIASAVTSRIVAEQAITRRDKKPTSSLLAVSTSFLRACL